MADIKHLPVVQTDPGEDEPSCSPKIYISNEEASLLAEMRHLREHSVELKKELRSADGKERKRLESKINEMRAKWRNLADQRERAFVRKMIMLGHLPPEADPDYSR